MKQSTDSLMRRLNKSEDAAHKQPKRSPSNGKIWVNPSFQVETPLWESWGGQLCLTVDPNRHLTCSRKSQ